MAQIPGGCGCGIGLWLHSHVTSSVGTSICHGCGPKKTHTKNEEDTHNEEIVLKVLGCMFLNHEQFLCELLKSKV